MLTSASYQYPYFGHFGASDKNIWQLHDPRAPGISLAQQGVCNVHCSPTRGAQSNFRPKT